MKILISLCIDYNTEFYFTTNHIHFHFLVESMLPVLEGHNNFLAYKLVKFENDSSFNWSNEIKFLKCPPWLITRRE